MKFKLTVVTKLFEEKSARHIIADSHVSLCGMDVYRKGYITTDRKPTCKHCLRALANMETEVKRMRRMAREV